MALDYHDLIVWQKANNLGFTSNDLSREANHLSDEVSKMLRTFIQRLAVDAKANRPSARVLHSERSS